MGTGPLPGSNRSKYSSESSAYPPWEVEEQVTRYNLRCIKVLLSSFPKGSETECCECVSGGSGNSSLLPGNVNTSAKVSEVGCCAVRVVVVVEE